jgi:cell division protein FtsB
MRNKRTYKPDQGKIYFNGISTVSRRNTVTDATDLAARLSTTLSELRDVMQQRKDQVEKLRDEITTIENQNEDLEKKIQDMIDSF